MNGKFSHLYLLFVAIGDKDIDDLSFKRRIRNHSKDGIQLLVESWLFLCHATLRSLGPGLDYLRLCKLPSDPAVRKKQNKNRTSTYPNI